MLFLKKMFSSFFVKFCKLKHVTLTYCQGNLVVISYFKFLVFMVTYFDLILSNMMIWDESVKYSSVL